MLNRSTPIGETSLRGLHPRSIDDVEMIRILLERVRVTDCSLHRGLNTMLDRETAHIDRIEQGGLVLRAPNFERAFSAQVFLNFFYAGRPYFFATTQTGDFNGDEFTVRIPETIYYSERRDRVRRNPDLEAHCSPDPGTPVSPHRN